MSQRVPVHMPAWSRPIRIPPRIDITHAQPPFAIAGETSTWRLPFVLSRDVPGGCTLKLQIAGGRNNKGWFDCKAPATELADGSPLDVAPGETDGTYLLSIPAAGLQRGEAVTVILAGCEAPRVRQLNKFFVLHTTPPEGTAQLIPQWAGGAVWAEGSDSGIVAVCTMHVLGGKLDHLRVYVPSCTVPGEELSVLIRPEDQFGNLSHERPGALSIFLGDEEMAHELGDVHDSACLRALVASPGEGTHRLRVVEKDTGREAISNPTI